MLIGCVNFRLGSGRKKARRPAILKSVASPLNFHLEQYEGPLDLLLDLIRKQQINIYDIPIARITAQYLDYMQRAMELDIELSSEFVYMAATLIHIKSRMLLPTDPELEKISPQEDPRKELVERLIEHERFKNAAEMLQQKRVIEEAIWSNPQISQFLSEEEGPALAVTIFDLVKTFQRVLERAKDRPLYEVGQEDITIPDMIELVKRRLAAARQSEYVSATELFESQRSRRAMICLFLAILELVKRQALELTQSETFGDIGLRRGPAFEKSQEAVEDLATIEQAFESFESVMTEQDQPQAEENEAPAGETSAGELDWATLKAIIEAAIYVTDEQLTAEQIAAALEQPLERVREILNQLVSEYAAPERGLAVRELAGGYKMSTKPEHHEAIRRFVKRLQPPLKLSMAALETLAVIAYKQPITAPEIMEIRGVQGAGVLKTLLDRKLIATAGRKNVLGKPVMYKTTREFLIQFGLNSLAELPTLKEFEELGRMALSETEEEVRPEPGSPAEAESVPQQTNE